ncbi:hypothetical protein AYI69_g4368 [Smittium culicis]|uniref:Uncharacterized protein n=1 Tax=Smittium culicis TaxID=133412 RepID=A0A1R1YEX7_9FUNG|nr:hypothetical protein AYI69_g4368 [Smittium culicis]
MPLSKDYNVQSEFISTIDHIGFEIEAVRMSYENAQKALKEMNDKQFSKESISFEIHEMIFNINRMFKLELKYDN